MTGKKHSGTQPPGRAVDDEDPNYSPMRDVKPEKAPATHRKSADTDASRRLKEEVKRDIERAQKGSA